MNFEIGFNREDKNDTKSFYEFIGATLNDTNDEYNFYEIELKSFEELEQLMEKINLKYKGNTFSYAAVISFDRPCIYLDDVDDVL